MIPQRIFFYTVFFVLSLFVVLPSWAQTPKAYHAGELQLALKKLNTLGSVLYVAAHPDDENTAMIAMLANDRLVRTAYLSLTRGDGGQNLIGAEQRELMGLIRTQELLQARKIDGGEQFFTRANDFGFSKNAQESFEIWGKEEVLADVVWIIRKYRPDVIINRFPPTREAGHGHHEASAILSIEAFEAAADPKRFPEQLKYVKPWQAKRLLWNCYSRRRGNFTNLPPDSGNFIRSELGTFNALLGKPHQVIAAESRSMHKSQGFGAAKPRGGRLDHLEHLAGERAKEDLLEGIDLTWNRIKGGKEIGTLLQKAYQNFNPENPSTILPELLKALEKIKQNPTQDHESQHWLRFKEKELIAIIKQCAGIWLDANAENFSASAGDSVGLKIEVIQQLPSYSRLEQVEVFYGEELLYALDSLPKDLKTNQLFNPKFKIKLSQNAKITQPYWLEEPPSVGLFKVNDRQKIGMPENQALLNAVFTLNLLGQKIQYKQPITYKWVKAEDQEFYRHFEITPALMVSPEENILMFSNGQAQTLEVSLKAGRNQLKGKLTPKIPQGWKINPVQYDFELANKNQEELITFEITPSKKIESVNMDFMVQLEGESNPKKSYGIQRIEYGHIPIQTVFPSSEIKLTNLDVQIAGKKIGYIAGAGDDIPQNLQQIGYEVSLLDEKNIQGNLAEFDAIVVGVRAYNTQDWLKYRHENLMQYVEKGGVLITQYHTPWRMVVPQLGPYQFEITRDRVTVEEAPIQFLKPEHPLLNYPNKITEKDFEGWIQERGLYFAGKWDKQYETIFSCHDPNEQSLEGALIVADYGKGRFIYTGFSFFRELPAGVTGAYRLFANLLAKEPSETGKGKAP